MDEDGLVRTLSARVASLEQQVKGDRDLIERLRRQLVMATRASEILRRAGGEDSAPMPVVPAPRSHVKPKRDRHGMYLVRGLGVAIVAAWAWVKASRWHQLITAAGLAAAVSTGSVMPSVVAPGSPAHAGGTPANVRHHDKAVILPPVGTPARKRRDDSGRNERNTPTPSPAPSAAGAGSPSPSPLPTPVPVPTVTPPAPTPTCVLPSPACEHKPGGCECKLDLPGLGLAA